MNFFLQKISRPVSLHHFFTCILLFLGCNTVCLADIVLHGNQIINAPTIYNSVTLDLTDGRFTIQPGGSLTITNSTVKSQITPSNPFLVQITGGTLSLGNNQVNVTVNGIAQSPDNAANKQLIFIQQGMASIQNNAFTITTPFTVALLSTQGIQSTNGLQISGNSITNFHGGLSLTNSNNANVVNNQFSNVSFSNIFLMGNGGKIANNFFLFPGNLHLGNAIDIVNADSLNITSNILSSSSNNGITITGCTNIFVENNRITDGKDFAIVINSPSLKELTKNSYLMKLFSVKKTKMLANDNIVIINNYIEQNRYGLTGSVINRLIVTNNVFLQKFNNAAARQYWTNNDNLLSSVSQLIWSNNEYKEAFTQVNKDDNTDALKFVIFPAQGGVVL